MINGEQARHVASLHRKRSFRRNAVCQTPSGLFFPLPADKADDITGPIKYDVTENTVHITWQEPAAPNGMIILYEVNYKRHGDTEVTHPPLFGFVSVYRGGSRAQGGVGSLWKSV